MYRRVDSEILQAVLIVQYPLHDDAEKGCYASDPNGLVCTRKAEHEGPHVAHGGRNTFGQHVPLTMWDDYVSF